MTSSCCQFCYRLVPQGVILQRLGAFWLCKDCWDERPMEHCVEFAHDYGGSIDSQGTACLCCRRCGHVLYHQAISTDIVKAPEPVKWDDYC